MIINRVWSMPSKWTFTIKPINELICRYVEDGKGWVDPFAGMYSPAEFTNDLNPKSPAKYHLEAIEFLNCLTSDNYNGCLFDPPYSLTQVSRSYENIGLKFKGKENPTGGFPNVKDKISKIVKLNGTVISFGWNSIGMGIKRGFEIVEILLVCHGGNRNDTIVTVENKISHQLKMEI